MQQNKQKIDYERRKSVKPLQKVLAIAAFLILVPQTVRHAYMLWLQPRGSVLDKYDQPAKSQISSATSLDELLQRYDPVRKEVDQKKEELAKAGKEVAWNDATEPYKSERMLHDAINEWEEKSREIHELRFYWFVGLALLAAGAFIYGKLNQWLGLTILITAFSEFIYWTSPAFFGPGTHEVDLLLANKLVLSAVSLVLLLAVIWANHIFAGQKPPANS
jgi:hypothetical protein